MSLCLKFKLVIRNTVRSDCAKFYDGQKHILKELMQIEKHKVSLTTHTWTSSNELPFTPFTAHLIDIEWRLHKKIISSCIIPVRATEENLDDIILVLCLTAILRAYALSL